MFAVLFLEQLCVCTSHNIGTTNYMIQIGFLYTPNLAKWKQNIQVRLLYSGVGGSITKL